MKTLSQLFENNRAWRESISESDPTFFQALSEQQNPDYLWIGCADSRVPANQVTGLMPGEVFVHRNIANVVPPDDLNLSSVLQYAVEELRVKHIIVCGHYGCGGVRAALDGQGHGRLDEWLKFIQQAKVGHEDELADLSVDAQIDRMCELNVLHQAQMLEQTAVMKRARAASQDIDVHSWIYSLNDGALKSL